MNKITWSIFAAVTIGLLAYLVILSNESKIDVSNVDVVKIQKATEKSGEIADHVYGKADSAVTLIEYGDFQCSACGTQYPTTKALTEAYKDKIAIIFRNFPLTSIHPNAKVAAAAAEAAGLQGKFWEMHDKLYEKQSDWDSLIGDLRVDTMVRFAKELGLDTEKFTTDISSKAVLAKINYDVALGTKVKLEGTPTFYLNGKLLNGNDWSDLDKFKATVDVELAAVENKTPADK